MNRCLSEKWWLTADKNEKTGIPSLKLWWSSLTQNERGMHASAYWKDHPDDKECKKQEWKIFQQALYEKAVENFHNQVINFLSPPNGEASLIKRAKEIRQGYGCSRSADGLYIALAEELALSSSVELLTFDKGFVNQVSKNAPTVKVNLLPV